VNGSPIQLLWAFLATVGFGILFRAPLRDLPIAALGGTLAWGSYLLLATLSGSDALSYFGASILVGLYSEAAAAILRRPATLFILCAIIPLVPGGGMYYTMFHAVSGDASSAASTGFATMTMAGAIAAGLAVASAVSRIFWLKKPRRLFPGRGAWTARRTKG